MRRPLYPVGAALVVALLLPAPAAVAAGPSGSANYDCNLTAGGSTPVSVTMSLDDPPESVAPGQILRLAGTLTFGFSTQTALVTQLLLAKTVGVSSADFALDAASGHHTDAIDAIAVQGKQTAIGKPFTVTAKVVLPAYTVPKTASDNVVISLPSKAKLPNDLAKSPAKVAFTAVLSESGLVGQRTMACALSDTDTTPLITRIPVDASAPASDAPSPSDLAPSLGDPGLSVPDSTSELGPATVDTPESSAQPQARPVFDAIPPATRHSGVFIPAWGIVLLVLMLPLGAVGYALSLRYRLRMEQLAAGTAEAPRVSIRKRSRQ